jgi:hypothetical protein
MNNPLKYNDPTGHIPDDGNRGTGTTMVKDGNGGHKVVNYTTGDNGNQHISVSPSNNNNPVGASNTGGHPSANVGGAVMSSPRPRMRPGTPSGFRNNNSTDDRDQVDSFAQMGRTYDPNNPNFHSYTLKTGMCNLGANGCGAGMVMAFAETESVPFETDPASGKPLTLFGGNPIEHSSGINWSLNVTLEGHNYHDGQVLHVVTAERGVIYLNTYGTGTGPNPLLNEAIGYTLFGKMHVDVWSSVKAQQIKNYYSDLLD